MPIFKSKIALSMMLVPTSSTQYPGYHEATGYHGSMSAMSTMSAMSGMSGMRYPGYPDNLVSAAKSEYPGRDL